MRKFLKYINVIQTKYILDSFNKKIKRSRLNPFNPLSYLTVLLVLLIGLILFGILGFLKEIDLKNPFKWQ